ncbi:unnamed protein product [Linum trigynum]|uniref:Uncharacterized protein n=1 Tax=Linum trigynum TaxID=586398 RepID=A0AAV2DD78_9ROSI
MEDFAGAEEEEDKGATVVSLSDIVCVMQPDAPAGSFILGAKLKCLTSERVELISVGITGTCKENMLMLYIVHQNDGTIQIQDLPLKKAGQLPTQLDLVQDIDKLKVPRNVVL